jgi:hypothetical protein
MRSRLIIAAALAVLSLVPTRTAASPVFEPYWSSSELRFGPDFSSQSGEDALRLWGRDIPASMSSFFIANTGPLAQLTLQRDLNGDVLSSEYLYTGGTFLFHVQIYWHDPARAGVSGFFIAPILSARHVVVDEADPHSSAVESYYRIGVGRLDAALARALEIGERTEPGEMSTNEAGLYNHILFKQRDGDYTTPFRSAHDGGLIMRVAVPEPALGVLALIGIGISRLRRRPKPE